MSTAIKEASTNQYNKKEAIFKCPVTRTLDKIGGRWKPIILYNLVDSTKRYNELKKAMPLISEKMLIQQLRELERDGLVVRIVHPIVPPHVEYLLSDVGREINPILAAMAEWGMKNG
jgi:DNA-binding HxlR family transcriptional regulator